MTVYERAVAVIQGVLAEDLAPDFDLADVIADTLDTEGLLIKSYQEGGQVVGDQDVTIKWCSVHGSPFNEHEGACIEWMAAPDDVECRTVPGVVMLATESFVESLVRDQIAVRDDERGQVPSSRMWDD